MGASAVALWVYLSLVVGVAAEAAGQIRVPFAIVWGVALGALALGAALGSSLALMMESLDLQGHVSVTAIAAMVLAVIASDVVLTRGSLARAYRRAVTCLLYTSYPEAKVVKLEQNYRSVGNILAAANAVIANNQHRKEKRLFTDSGDGEKISVYLATDERDEGPVSYTHLVPVLPVSA